MEKVSQKFLAQLAKSESPVLNKAPLQDGDYNIEFKSGGFKFHFSQKNGRWQWNYKAI